MIISGIYGISVYAALPRSLSNNREETTQAQMLETREIMEEFRGLLNLEVKGRIRRGPGPRAITVVDLVAIP